ncbi:hypothetical protein GGS26DRAFT_407494 [Hypomontagnella submonticulosa]|nr:hypothetical protein GGS26DRAFT_407494 [Hypomontagnella submonticulosa]
MRLASLITVISTLPASLAAQQRVQAHSTIMQIEDAPSSMESRIASTPVLEVNATNPPELTPPPKPLTTTVPAEKPALEASVMGLVVFSAAGLFLL